MKPSEVRERILADHARLRASLSELERLANLVLEGRRGLDGRLRSRGKALRVAFLAHLDLEDRHLVPALREADGWGDERAARVCREHAEQRRRMDALLCHLADLDEPSAWVAGELGSLVEDLLVDMAHEEKTVLSEDLLRDDPVAIDVEAG